MRYGEAEAIGPGSQAEPIWKEERGAWCHPEKRRL